MLDGRDSSPRPPKPKSPSLYAKQRDRDEYGAAAGAKAEWEKQGKRKKTAGRRLQNGGVRRRRPYLPWWGREPRAGTVELEPTRGLEPRVYDGPLGGASSLSGADARRGILPLGCRRSGEATPADESRRPRVRLFWPHWSSTSLAPPLAESEKSEGWWWWPWSRAGLRVPAADEEGAAAAGGGGARARCLGSSEVEARYAARRELSVPTTGGATSSLLDLWAGAAAGGGGFLLPPLPIPSGSGRQSGFGLWYLQQKSIEPTVS
jgi:hypothetical protein